MTASALIALYRRAGSAASDYFTERCGIYIHDGGQDEEYAVQQAHRETVEWMRGRLDDPQDVDEFERLISCMEKI